MILRTKERRFLLFAFLFVMLTGLFFGITSVKKTKADELTWYPIYSGDLTVTEACSSEGNTFYQITMEHKANTTIINSSYAAYATVDILIETEKGKLYLDKINGNSQINQFQLMFLYTDSENKSGYDDIKPTELIFHKGLKFEFKDSQKTKNGYLGLEFTEEIIFYKTTADSWSETAYVEIEQTVEEEAIKEKISETVDSYTLAMPKSIDGKVFLGWEYGDRLYKAGESVSVSEYLASGEIMAAVYLQVKMKEGASIRYDQSGIRFALNVDKTDYEAKSSYILGVGIIVMPSDLLGDAEFTLKNYGESGQAKDFYAEKEKITFLSGSVFTLYATLSNVKECNYNRLFRARGYVLVNYGSGEEYVWTDGYEERTIYDVAVALLEKDETENKLLDWQKDVLEKYVALAATNPEEAV